MRHILLCRRMIYLQTILRRDDSELTKRVYKSQKQSAIKGDFYNLVKDDFAMIGESIDEAETIACSLYAYKKRIKEKIRDAAFQYLQQKQKMHSKVRDIKYTKLKTQKYMTSPLFSDEEVALLFAMRSKCVRECRTNFSSMYNETKYSASYVLK